MKSTKSQQSNPIEQPPPRRICTSSLVPLLLLWMLPAGLGLMLTGRVSAQTFTTLYNGTVAGLVLSGNTLYGTVTGCGWTGCGGTLFALNTDGRSEERRVGKECRSRW